MYQKFGYFAVWMPNSAVSLGDVGVVRGHRFHRMTSLAELGVGFETAGPGTDGIYAYSSAGQVDVAVSGEVALPAVMPGVEPLLNVTVTFHSAHATFLRAARCATDTINDVLSLEQKIDDLREAGVWRREFVVVTELVRSGPAVILVSSRAGTRVEFQASAELVPMSLPLGGVAAGFGTSLSSGLAAEVFVPEGGLTPLFGLSVHRRRPGGRRKLRVRGPGAEPSKPRTLVPVSWDEFAHDPVAPL
ncbi:hypothetical protein ACFWFI_01110 [Streptomyces sp. NPDC060209]|uniref:hypothetical protein n=1 Tax=Streptomyces sp. NPDC060209 TaxID=3347073 RepID=UPI0036630A75